MAQKGITEFCEECFPKICACPMSPAQVIEARMGCLADSVWNDDELRGFREELQTYASTMQKEFQQTAQNFFEGDDLGPKEKKRFRTQLGLFWKEYYALHDLRH